nr:MAG TPA: hypothetical protein [Caudoviricetes sp.]
MCCGDNKGLSLTSIKKGTLMVLWSHQLKPFSPCEWIRPVFLKIDMEIESGSSWLQHSIIKNISFIRLVKPLVAYSWL